MRHTVAESPSRGHKRAGRLVLTWVLCGGLFPTSPTNAQVETAIDALVAREPEVAEAFAAGADPADLRLSSGQSLAEYLAAAATTSGLVYRTLPPCRVLATHLSTDGKMAAGESRSFLVRGEIDLTSQGGPATGCGVPPAAKAVMMSFVVFRSDGNGALWTRAAGQASYEPLVNVRARDTRNNATIQRLCVGTCVADLDLRTVSAGAHVAARVTGYFSPLARTVQIPASPPSPEAIQFAQNLAPGVHLVGFDASDIGYGPGDGVNEQVPFTFAFDEQPHLIVSAWVVLDLTIGRADFNTDGLWLVDQPAIEGKSTLLGLASIHEVGDRIEVEIGLSALERHEEYLLDGKIDLVYGDDAIIHGAVLTLRGLVE